jgi:Flp pilus assembly protein TadB
MSEGLFSGEAMRKHRRPHIFAAFAALVIVAAVVTFFVPTKVALFLVAVAAVLVAVGGAFLARQL